MLTACLMAGVSGWGCGGSETGEGSDAPVLLDVDAGVVDATGGTLDAEGEGHDGVGDGVSRGPGADSNGDITSPDAAGPRPEDAGAGAEQACSNDADCAYLAAGIGSCRAALCQSGVCVAVAREGWTLCDDLDPCTQNDVCVAGSCVGSGIEGCASGEVAESDVVISEIHFDGADNAVRTEFVELFNRSQAPIDLSGWVLEDGVHFAFAAGTTIASGQYLVVAEDPETLLAVYGASSVGPYASNLSSEGERLVLRDASGDLADEVGFAVGYPWPIASGGTGASMELVHPLLDNDLGGSWRASSPGVEDDLRVPSPGAPNTVRAPNAPPQSRQVAHMPQIPTTGEPVRVSVKVTDPQGVAEVSLEYQVVLPGAYLPARLPVPHGTLLAIPDMAMSDNPAYFAAVNWVPVTMHDDGAEGDDEAGDNRYTVTLPPQGHRTLVRYRIRVADTYGTQVTVPYDDDSALNFAYFVYDGVPSYGEHPAEVMTSLPVYTLIARAEDIAEVTAYNGSQQIAKNNEARFAYNWPLTLVHDGVVYDNIRFRLRGGNGRYQLTGKRTYRFRFNRGSWFQAIDALGTPYPQRWRTLTTGKGFDNRKTLTYDVNCVINSHLMRAAGVPAPRWHWFHLRVIDAVAEAPDPWTGDFWGLHSATQTYDKRYLESHGLEKGNLYKLVDAKSNGVDQRRYQAPDAVSDGSDHDNIEQNLTGHSSAEFIRGHVNLPNWYAYHAVAEAVRHYDFWPSANKNQVYYFSPDYEPANSGYGRLWVLPWDSDASWGPSWNQGHDAVYNALYPANGGGSDGAGTPELHHEYMNVVREVRDLLWQPDQIEPLLDRLTDPLLPFAAADRERWTGGPQEAGSFNGLGGAGATSLEALVDDLKAFAFQGGNWPGGAVGPGGRGAHLDTLQASDGEGGKIPDTPVISAVGPPDYPVDALTFASESLSDPQGAETVAAIAWRIAEDAGPDLDPTVALRLEMVALWESEPLEVTPGAASLPLGVIPTGVAMAGTTYRVRARALDTTGRWGHWSAPVVFTAGPPQNDPSILTALRLTEVMYNPAEPAKTSPHGGADFEFLEFQNSATEALSLGAVQLVGGVQFTFPVGTVVDPGSYVLVVRDMEAFEARYGNSDQVVGSYDGKLNNGGEAVSLVVEGGAVSTWTYDDEAGWPTRADGLGSSLEIVSQSADPSQPSSWRASAELHGSPGWLGAGPTPGPVINEVAALSDDVEAWQVELGNPTDDAVDLSGWWLGVAPIYDAFVIPDGVVLPAGGYVTLGTDAPLALPLYGDEHALWLVEPGWVTHLWDQVDHGAGPDAEAWGRWPDRQGPLYPMVAFTPGAENAGPRIGPVLLSELMVTPTEASDGVVLDDLEYVELHNPSDWPEALGGWQLEGGVDLTLPVGTWIAAGGTLLVLSWDPAVSANADRLALFREHYGLTDATPLIGGYDGTLSDLGEDVSLWRLSEDETLSLEDGVTYGLASGQTGALPGPGEALHRQGTQSPGLDPESWTVGAATPGSAFDGP